MYSTYVGVSSAEMTAESKLSISFRSFCELAFNFDDMTSQLSKLVMAVYSLATSYREAYRKMIARLMGNVEPGADGMCNTHRGFIICD